MFLVYVTDNFISVESFSTFKNNEQQVNKRNGKPHWNINMKYACDFNLAGNIYLITQSKLNMHYWQLLFCLKDSSFIEEHPVLLKLLNSFTNYTNDKFYVYHDFMNIWYNWIELKAIFEFYSKHIIFPSI